MVVFFIFLIVLTIYQISTILERRKEDVKKSIIIYFIFLILTIIVWLYYKDNFYGDSLSTKIFRLLNIKR